VFTIRRKIIPSGPEKKNESKLALLKTASHAETGIIKIELMKIIIFRIPTHASLRISQKKELWGLIVTLRILVPLLINS
jgi:hypothetical protein